MAEVSLLRLYVLRAVYLLNFLGVGWMAWPRLTSGEPLTPIAGVAFAFWGALSLLAAVGIRYPLHMIPVLMMQLVYKVIWLAVLALPLWRAGAPFDPEMAEFTRAMAVGAAVDLVVIPWAYVWAIFVRWPGDRWTRLKKI